MSENDTNIIGESHRQDILQHGPDEMLCRESRQSMHQTLLVGQVREISPEEASLLKGQHFVLNYHEIIFRLI